MTSKEDISPVDPSDQVSDEEGQESRLSPVEILQVGASAILALSFVGGVGYSIYVEHQKSSYSELNPGSEMHVTDKVVSYGGNKMKLFYAGKPMQVVTTSQHVDNEQYILFVGQDVKNGLGDRAVGIGGLFVDAETYNAFAVGDSLVPNEIKKSIFHDYRYQDKSGK